MENNVFYKTYAEGASVVDNWQNKTITELANGYCDADEAGDEYMRDAHFYALICRYWYMVTYLYTRRKSVLARLEYEDFQDWVIEAIARALKYKRWRNSEYEISKEPDGAKKIIDRCLYSVEKGYYKYYNQDCRKMSYTVSSLDAYQESLGLQTEDSDDYDEEFLEDDSYDETKSSCNDIVKYYIRQGKLMEAYIVDGICFYDTYSTEKSKVEEVNSKGEKVEYVSYKYKFNKRLLAQHLMNLDDNYYNEFTVKYNVPAESISRVTYNESNKRKLYSKIKDTIEDMKNNKEILHLLHQN